MKKTLILLSALLPFATLAQAQNNLKDLRKEARDLTLMSRLSPEDQEKFKAWQSSQKELAASVKSIREKALQAYNDALKNQKSAGEARLLAQKAVIDDRIALISKVTELRNTAAELAQKYPFLMGSKHKHMKSQFKKQFLKERMNHHKHR